LCSKCLFAAVLDDEPAEDPRSSVLPPFFGAYELIEEVARGGMGIVYKARQIKVNRIVAVKVLAAGAFASRDFLQRFRTEAETVASLNHPNIVPIYEVGDCAGQPFFSMRFVEDGPLSKRLADRSSPMAQPEAVRLLVTLAHAVQFAHQRGILHRDIKPGNVLLSAEGEPLLTDFGLAKLMEKESTLTRTLAMLGTPSYMSPEQARGEARQLTTAVDIYGLGAVFYELLTGRPPFAGGTTMETVRQVLESEPLRPSTLRSGIDRDLETICLKCLEKEPSHRYASAEALAADLERWRRQEPIVARPVGTGERITKWVRRRPKPAALIAVTLLAVAAAAFTLLASNVRLGKARVNEAHLRQQAEDKAEESRRRLVRLNVNTGNRLVENGDPHEALLWLVAALALDEENAARSRIHRQRIAAVMRQAPHLDQIWFHDAFVFHAAFSPDGSRVACGGLDHTVHIWDTETGRELTSPLPHPGELREVRFTDDGKRLLGLTQGGRLHSWDAVTGQPICLLPTQAAPRSFDLSRDGRRVAAPVEGGARIFDLGTGEALSPLLAHANQVTSVRFHADETVVSCASGSGRITEWNVSNGQRGVRWSPHDARITSMAFSPDRSILATVSAPGIRLWNAASREMISELPPMKSALYEPSISPDGRWMATAGFTSGARTWDIATGQPVSPPLKHRGGVKRTVFSPDGQRVATASWDRTARVWDAQTGTPISPVLHHAGFVLVADFSPDGSHLLTTGQDGTARLWGLGSATARATLSSTGAVWVAVFDDKGRRIMTGSQDGTASVWECSSGRLLSSIQFPEPVYDGGFCALENRVVVSCLNDVHVWNLDTGEVVTRSAELAEQVFVMDITEISPDGERFVTGSRDGTARVWSARDAQPLTPPMSNGDNIRFVRFSPDGELLLTAGNDGRARLWNARTGRRHGPDMEHVSMVVRARFSADGRRIVTACTDTTMMPRYAQVWDVETGAPVGPRLYHKDGVLDAAFSPDGRRIVTAGEDRAAIIWDAETGQCHTPAMWHSGYVLNAIFSPDSQLVLTVSWDGTARVWDAATSNPVTPPLRHNGQVHRGQWSPDGMEVLTASSDGTARVWDISPAEGTVEAWQRQAELLSAQRIESSLGTVPLTAREMQSRWEAMEKDRKGFY
jgi:WD40 repeat protein/tRNA A-37 threonylcarbamoyl transferase component Bud32